MATAAAEAKPLTPAERKLLDGLLQRAGQAAPAAVTGDAYVALVNLTVRRRGGKDNEADLVRAGETVHLTPEEAAPFLRCDPNTDGRRIPVIRRAGDGETAERLARPLPRQLSGVLHAPPPPPPGSDGPRPDPPGSSRIQYMTDARVPESAEPAPGSEQDPAQVVDALDIAPGTARTGG
jgi:hypothetical protein